MKMRNFHLFVFIGALLLIGAGVSSADKGAADNFLAPADDPCRFPYLNGWPLTIGLPYTWQISESPIPANFDPSSPENELALCVSGLIFVWTHDGQNLNGWPVQTGNPRGPAIMLENNVGKAAVVTTSGTINLLSYQGFPLPNWPISTHQEISHRPILADLNGDSVKEIIHFIDINNGSRLGLCAWTQSGNLMPGFPVDLTTPISGLAVGDVNADGRLEIICATMITAPHFMYVVSSEGQILYTWPVMPASAGGAEEQPILADLDGNGDLEIIQGGQGTLFVWHYDGTPYWPMKVIGTFATKCAVGDLEGDDTLEVVACCDYSFYAFNYNGRILAGNWPILIQNGEFSWEGGGTPDIGDVDSDGQQEICKIALSYTPWRWLIISLEPDGTMTPGFPINLGPTDFWCGTPALTDLDQDGNVDLCAYRVLSSTLYMVVYDLGAPYNPELMDWPMANHDPQRTGCLPSAFSRATLPTQMASAAPLNFWNIDISPNPFNPITVLSFELQVPSHVSLRVYDTAGRLVATLADGWREAGEHQVTFEGAGLPSGIYLVRVTMNSESQIQKLVLIK